MPKKLTLKQQLDSAFGREKNMEAELHRQKKQIEELSMKARRLEDNEETGRRTKNDAVKCMVRLADAAQKALIGLPPGEDRARLREAIEHIDTAGHEHKRHQYGEAVRALEKLASGRNWEDVSVAKGGTLYSRAMWTDPERHPSFLARLALRELTDEHVESL